MIHAVGYAMLALIAATGGLTGLLVLISMLREQRVRRLGWTDALREVICADSQMLTDAFRLSLAHFRAVNDLRKLGGGR